MKKILKALNYLKNNGIINFIKRVKMNIKFINSKEYINRNGIYFLKRKNKYVTYKNKHVYVIAMNPYYNSKIKDEILKLNMLGYAVHYYHIKDDNNKYKELLPLIEKKRINRAEVYNIKNKLVILDDIKNCDKSNTIYNDHIVDKIPSQFIKNISIIVLNYNNLKVIEKCINALIKYNKYKYEIIVVDNCSTDGSYELLKDKYKNEIILLRNKANGCSSGRNLAISKVKRDYIMFLDSDQIAKNKNWLDNYLEIINPNVVIGWAAGWFNKDGYAGAIVDNYEMRCMPPSALYRKDIGYLGSGGMFMNKQLFLKTEGFDETYDPTGYEDTDISLQIRNLGYDLIYCPYLGIIHKAHQTTSNVLTDERINKNSKYFKQKWIKLNKKLLKYKK